MTVYLVTGRREYRGHTPGDTFEANLDPAAEQRAIRRGDIEIVDGTRPSLQPGSYTLPDGWPEPPESAPRTTEAPRRRLHH